MSQPLQFETGTVAALLRDSLVTLDQGLERVPEAWLQRPLANGAWSISRNVAHLAIYEELLAAPALEELARGGDGMAVVPEVPRTRADFDRIEADLQQRLDEARARLREARQRQAAVVERLDPIELNRATCVLWSEGRGMNHSPGWVAMKTVQHTWEHGNTVLQAMLFAPRE